MNTLIYLAIVSAVLSIILALISLFRKAKRKRSQQPEKKYTTPRS